MPPPFSPSTGGFIPRATGKAGIAAYRASAAFAANSNVKAHALGLDHIRTLTNQTNCAGIRIWYGMDTSNKPQLYLVAIDANGDDILTPGNELVLDMTSPCPTDCPTTTSLEN